MEIKENDLIEYLNSVANDTFPNLSDYPVFYSVHALDDYRLLYTDDRAMEFFGFTQEEIIEKGTELHSTTHPADLAKAISICDHYQANQDVYNSISYFQRITVPNINEGKSMLFFSTSKIADIGLVSCIQRIDDSALALYSLDEVLEETDFILNNLHRFSKLTKREVEVVKQLVHGYSLKEIAKQLEVTLETIKTYKKRIYKKLEIHQYHKLYFYAKAFDLIDYEL